jgi:hypothetical protein
MLKLLLENSVLQEFAPHRANARPAEGEGYGNLLGRIQAGNGQVLRLAQSIRLPHAHSLFI